MHEEEGIWEIIIFTQTWEELPQYILPNGRQGRTIICRLSRVGDKEGEEIKGKRIG